MISGCLNGCFFFGVEAVIDFVWLLDFFELSFIIPTESIAALFAFSASVPNLYLTVEFSGYKSGVLPVMVVATTPLSLSSSSSEEE